MSLVPGRKLGPYEIVAPLGAGGMGEVWRARDTRLGRDVAVKILPPLVAADAERLARFHREAQVLASLNHPNVGAIYGVEDAGGAPALVLELVEGPTLADRIARGPMPPEEAVPIARQIAEALEYAHDRGVVHRDLKPANVKLDAEGRAKVLDFGLAKAIAGDPSGRGDSAVGMSPTITSLGTIAGALLGTAAYMSPEQARGGSVDRRADIWAFGALLWEMLTGRRAFEGDTVSDTLAAVLRAPVDWESLPSAVPRSLRKLIARCLERDPKKRLRDIGEARIALESFGVEPEPEGPSASAPTAPPEPRPLWLAVLPWGIAVLAIAAAIAMKVMPGGPTETPRVTRFGVTRPEKLSTMEWPRLSPDGRMVAFLGRAADASEDSIWIRPLDAFDAYPLAGTAGAGRPWWSPDSRYLAFFVGDKLLKVAVAGGPTQQICVAGGSDGTWGAGGVILFDFGASDPIRRVSASGGVATDAIKPDAATGLSSAGWPVFLPDGRHFLFVGMSPRDASNQSTIYVSALDEPGSKPLVATNSRVEYTQGRLVYVLQDTLVAQRFDEKRLEVVGDPVPLASGVSAAGGRVDFSVSGRGDLVYMASSRQGKAELAWLDRSGKEIAKVGPLDAYREIALSPDGTRLAYALVGAREGSDVWVRDLRRDAATRVTTDPSEDIWPVWSPDGARIAFASNRGGGSFAVLTRAATGTGPEDTLRAVDNLNIGPSDWSVDGRWIAVAQITGGANWDIDLLQAKEKGEPVPIAHDKAAEWQPRFSPDGKWLAYTSDESGKNEVYVQTLPPSGQKWTISTGGGCQPAWRADGREIFYLGPDSEMMAVPVTLAPRFEAGIPKVLFKRRVVTTGLAVSRYAVSADGQRFLLSAPVADEAPVPFSLVLDALAK